jgi:L-threonylcarbamoyladenylate synthase
MILKLTEENIAGIINAAIAVLEKGGIIAYPTETFYGLGAKYDIAPALKRVYEIKKRPREKAMPVIIGGKEQLRLLADSISPSANALMNRFWPGPLTLLLHARNDLNEYISYENKVAARIPGESFALSLAEAAGFPITATSANTSGMPPADSASMVFDYFNDDIDLLIDGGKTKGGLPSTIVDASGEEIKILRKGAIAIQSDLT